MGTTAVAALMLAECAVIASVGDSRAYLVTPSHSMQLTEDHTVAQLYAERGLISREAARRHPLRNVLLKSVGSPRAASRTCVSSRWRSGTGSSSAPMV